MSFHEWWNQFTSARVRNLEWLNANAAHIAPEWYIWHSGGGCTHYCADGTYKGRKVQFVLCHDSDAERDWQQDSPLWMLSANAVDSDGDFAGCATLASEAFDGRDCIQLANLAAPFEWDSIHSEARAFMATRPDLAPLSLDEWLAEHGESLSDAERREGADILQRFMSSDD